MKIRMINSVDEYVAGEEYEVDDDVGNRFVVLGYAETDDPVLAFTDEERQALAAQNQTVGV